LLPPVELLRGREERKRVKSLKLTEAQQTFLLKQGEGDTPVATAGWVRK